MSKGVEDNWSPTDVLWRRPTCVCTSPWNESSPAAARLSIVSEWFEALPVPRNNRSILQVLQEEQADAVIVAEMSPRIYHALNPEQPVFFHPGMAQQRLATLQRTGSERLVARAKARPGDTVVDATLGLGTDSLVLAAAVGPAGRVQAIEASWLLARLFLFEKFYPGANYSWLAPLLSRIEVITGDHGEILSTLPNNSVATVLFDPMFRHPSPKQSNLSSARRFTLPMPLQERAWREAQRVTHGTVVLKERPESGEFQRFSLVPDKRRAPFAYGVWEKSVQ